MSAVTVIYEHPAPTILLPKSGECESCERFARLLVVEVEGRRFVVCRGCAGETG